MAYKIQKTEHFRPDQEYFYTKEWQAKEAEADKSIAKGVVSKVYDDVDELIKDLNF